MDKFSLVVCADRTSHVHQSNHLDSFCILSLLLTAVGGSGRQQS